jgi:hypothetical protein
MKAAERQLQKDERDRAKALQLPQRATRKASATSAPKSKRQKHLGGDVAADVAGSVTSAAPPKVTYGAAT